MKKILIAFFFIPLVLSAQSDTSDILGPDRFFKLVRAYHPVVRQADLKLNYGRAGIQKARGGFDPKLQFSSNQKEYSGISYFNTMSGSLSIPTYLGVEIKAGQDRNQGTYLNPENYIPSTGLTYAGLSVSLGQGLLMDERRLALRQAHIYGKASVAERSIMLNNLLYEAGKAYWDWFAAFHSYKVYEEALRASVERLESVKQTVFLGDRPSIDTLEAYIQKNERQFSLMQAKLDWKNKSILLSNYLWTENMDPVEISELVRAPRFEDHSVLDEFSVPDSGAWSAHPELLFYQFKIQSLQVERRWKVEQIKPIINLSYQPYFTSSDFNSYSLNDYKLGVTFRMPLLLRKERGDLKMTDYKINEANWDLSMKRQMIKTKNLVAINEFNATFEMIGQYTQTVSAYGLLLDSEKSIFQAGESSLFLINAREMSYIGARLKLIDVVVKNKKAVLGANFMAGLLGQ